MEIQSLNRFIVVAENCVLGGLAEVAHSGISTKPPNTKTGKRPSIRPFLPHQPTGTANSCGCSFSRSNALLSRVL